MWLRITVSIFILCVLGCRQEENNAHAKFVAFAQQYGDTRKSVLINKVHKSKWKISYGFADNKKCDGTFDDQRRAQLMASFSQVLQTWLQPLRSKGNIVSGFDYELKKN